jgi:hypothetical protein
MNIKIVFALFSTELLRITPIEQKSAQSATEMLIKVKSLALILSHLFMSASIALLKRIKHTIQQLSHGSVNVLLQLLYQMVCAMTILYLETS